METLGFEIQQNFQALRLNESMYGFVSPFGFFQDQNFQLSRPEGSISLHAAQTAGVGLSEEVIIKNFVPASLIKDGPRFRQRTFSGKPLSDEDIIQANQLAADLDDQAIIRRLLGR